MELKLVMTKASLRFRKKKEPKDKRYKKAPYTVPIIVLVKASASRHQQ